MFDRHCLVVVVLCLVSLPGLGGLAGCSASMGIENPYAELHDTSNFPTRHRAAMRMLDETAPDDPEYLELLHGIIWKPGYIVDTRKEALLRLEKHDLDGLKRTIRQRLPRMTAWGWLRELCSIIADRRWVGLTPALTSSWARPTPLNPDETDRPEYQALVQLHGEAQVADVVFDLFLESDGVAQQGLRTRCWDLMHRLGYRERLIDLVTSVQPCETDAMLIDLHAGATQLGIIPHNREEILWLRKLREPSRASFWDEARRAMARLPVHKRTTLELRNLPIVVSAARHAPEMLEQSSVQLYAKLEAYLQTQRRHVRRSAQGTMRSGDSERLSAHRNELTWGDLAAMLLAIRAFEVPQMVDHLFEYAERDRQDTTTEYGGVIRLDQHGRFELLEFLPTIRRHDNEFIAPQAMLDEGYTALFHFHYHAQRYRNADFAGPGFGDLNYADNTRANCLVFTFINRDTMNMDFYRHGRVVVDLGEVKR